MRGPARTKRGWLSAVAISGLSHGCIIAGDKCDAHQVHLTGDYDVCVCEPDSVLNPNGVGCKPCGANQEIQNGACACKTGYVAADDGASCVASEIGTPCSASLPCSAAAFPYCAPGTSGQGYCTREGCTANADCPAGWSCEVADAKHYCHRPPTGLNAPCKSSADCAGFEASYCENFQSFTCLVQGCATAAVSCPNEWVCCDYSALFGAPLSICNAPALLVSGACPMGGRLVTP